MDREVGESWSFAVRRVERREYPVSGCLAGFEALVLRRSTAMGRINSANPPGLCLHAH